MTCGCGVSTIRCNSSVEETYNVRINAVSLTRIRCYSCLNGVYVDVLVHSGLPGLIVALILEGDRAIVYEVELNLLVVDDSGEGSLDQVASLGVRNINGTAGELAILDAVLAADLLKVLGCDGVLVIDDVHITFVAEGVLTLGDNSLRSILRSLCPQVEEEQPSTNLHRDLVAGLNTLTNLTVTQGEVVVSVLLALEIPNLTEVVAVDLAVKDNHVVLATIVIATLIIARGQCDDCHCCDDCKCNFLNHYTLQI